MAKIKLKQVRSSNGCTERQLGTLKALGFKKVNSSVEKEVTPQLMGMIEKVKHLVVVENK
jgi:large subunit ribosomal protein L30